MLTTYLAADSRCVELAQILFAQSVLEIPRDLPSERYAAEVERCRREAREQAELAYPPQERLHGILV